MFVPLSQSCIGGPGCVFSKCDTWGSTVLGNNIFLVQELAANVTHFLCGWKEQKINYKEVLPFPSPPSWPCKDSNNKWYVFQSNKQPLLNRYLKRGRGEKGPPLLSEKATTVSFGQERSPPSSFSIRKKHSMSECKKKKDSSRRPKHQTETKIAKTNSNSGYCCAINTAGIPGLGGQDHGRVDGRCGSDPAVIMDPNFVS